MNLVRQLKSIGIVFLALVVLWVFLTRLSSKDVRMAIVRKGSLQDYLEFTGQIEVEQKETVYSKYDGKVRKFLVSEGLSVLPFDKLLLVNLSDWGNSLKKAENSYRKMQSQVEQLRRKIGSDPVKLAQNLLQQAEAIETLARGKLVKVNDKLQEVKRLHESNKATAAELVDWQERLQIAGRALAEAVRKTEVARKNLELVKKAINHQELAEAEFKLKQLGLEVEQLRKNPGQAGIYAGISGRVVRKYVAVGEKVAAGDRLLELENSQTAYVRSELPAAVAAKIRIGQKVLISGAALGGKVIEGSVGAYTPLASAKNHGEVGRKFKVRVNYDTIKTILRTNSKVNLKFIINEAVDVLFIPKRAVFQRFGRHQVYVVERGKAFLRTVETGIADAENIEIKRGLFLGEQVILDPGIDLRPGMKVVDTRGL